MAIGELAARFDLPTHVLRHWESMGLLDPERDAAGRRRYGPEHLVRVAMVLRAKEAGLGLADIARMIHTGPGERREVLERSRDRLTARIAAARASLELVEGALGCDHEDLMTCPRFQAQIASIVDARPA